MEVSVVLKLALVSERVLAVARVTTSTAMAAAVSAVVCSIASISTGGRCWRWPPHVRPAIAAPAVIAACWYANALVTCM
jgi:predicted alpha-1,6-mannanase (GH76 family)